MIKLLLSLHSLLLFLRAQTECFPPNLPSYLHYDHNLVSTREDAQWNSVVSDSAGTSLYLGGQSEYVSPYPQITATLVPFVAKYSVADGTYTWGKVYQSSKEGPNYAGEVKVMALSPDENYLMVAGNVNQNYWYFLYHIYASTGLPKKDALFIESTSDYNVRLLRNSQILWYDTQYIALMFDFDHSKHKKDARSRFYRVFTDSSDSGFSVSTEYDAYGRFAALAYHQSSGKVIFGGSHSTSLTSEQYVLTFGSYWKDGNSNRFYEVSLKYNNGNYYTADVDRAQSVVLMEFGQGSYQHVLHAFTQDQEDSKSSKDDGFMLYTRLRFSSDFTSTDCGGSYPVNCLVLKYVPQNTVFSDKAKAMAMKFIMNSSDESQHYIAVIFHDKAVFTTWYWRYTNQNSQSIFKMVGKEVFYAATFTSQTITFSTTNSIGQVYLAYLVGNGKDMECQTTPISPALDKITPVIVPFTDNSSETCLSATFSSPSINLFASETFSWITTSLQYQREYDYNDNSCTPQQADECRWDSDGEDDERGEILGFDYRFDQTGKTTCQACQTPRTYTFTPGQFSSRKLNNGNSDTLDCDFTPITYTDTAATPCDSSNPKLNYQIDYPNTVSAQDLLVYIDSVNNKIVMKVTDSNVQLGSHTFTARGTLPNGESSSFTFNLVILNSSAAQTCLVECVDSTGLIQLTDTDTTVPAATFDYYLAESTKTITFSPVTYSGTIECDINDVVYTMTKTPTTVGQSTSWINLSTTSRTVTIYATAPNRVGQYTIVFRAEIVAANSVQAGNVKVLDQTFVLNVKQCSDTTETVILTGADPNFSASVSQFINAPQQEIPVAAISYDPTSTTHCSASDIVYTDSIVPTPPSGLVITFSSMKFTVGAVSDTSLINTSYVLSYVATITTSSNGSDPTEVKQITQTFTLTIRECASTTGLIWLENNDPASPQGTYDYYINKPVDLKVFSFLDYVQTAPNISTDDCSSSDIDYTCTVSPVITPSPITVICASRVVTWSSTQESDLGTYTIKFTGTITAPSADGSSQKSVDQIITLNIKKCSQTTNTFTLADSDSTLPLDPTEYFVYSPSNFVEFSAVILTVEGDCTQNDIVYTYSVTSASGSSISMFTIPDGERKISYQTNDIAQIGSYTMTMTGTVVNDDPTKTQSIVQSITFEIKGCSQTADPFTVDDPDPTNPAISFDYFVKTGSKPSPFQMDAFTVTGTTACKADVDIVYSFTVQQADSSIVDFSSFLTFDQATMKFNIDLSDLTKVGTYTVTLYGKITAPFSPSSIADKEADQTFTLNILKCSDSTGSVSLSDSDLALPADQQYIICVASTDIFASVVNYDAGSTDECDSTDIEYSLDAGGLENIVFYFDPSTRKVTINTCDGNYIGFHTVTVIAKVNNAVSPPPQLDQSFTIQIISDEADIITPVIYEKIVYKYTQQAGKKIVPYFTINQPGFQDATWEYAFTYESSDPDLDTTFISAFENSLQSQIEFEWSTEDIRQPATVKVKIRGTLTASWGAVFYREIFFELDLKIPSCSETPETIQIEKGQEISDELYYLSEPALIVTVVQFVENQSISCKPSDIIYTMKVRPSTSGQSTAFIELEVDGLQVSVQTDNVANQGQFYVDITGTILNDFAKYELVQTFQLTVLADPCSNDDIKLTSANQADINFEFGQGPLATAFSFSDSEGGACWADWTYELYFLDSMKKVDEIGIKRDGVSIDFDSEQMVMEIQSIIESTPIIIPVQLAVSREKFQNFTQVNFNIKLKKYVDPQFEDRIPYFEKIEVSKVGKVKVIFSERFMIPGKPEEIDEDVLSVQFLPETHVPEKYQHFTWKFVSYTPFYMVIKLQFENPIYISSEGLEFLDNLRVVILDPSFFLSENLQMPIVNTYVQGKVPQQFEDEDSAAKMQAAADTAAAATKALMGASLIFNFLFAFALSQIWDTLNSLQIIGYMTYFNVYMPNHVSTFYTVILDLAEFNFFDVTPYAKMVFPFLEERGDNEEEQVNQDEEVTSNQRRRLAYTVGNDEEADIENLHEILQILSGLMLISLLVPMVLFFLLLFYFMRKLHKSLNKAFNSVWSLLFWNGPIRYFIESYISISVAYVSWFSWTNQWSMPVDYFINIFCIASLIIYGLSPLFFTIFLRLNFTRMREQGFRHTYHELIEKLNFRTIQSSNYISIFCYRRLLLALFIVFMAKTPYFQIQLQIYTVQVVFVAFGMSNALRWSFDRVMEYFNECCVLLCAYHYFLFTDFVPDAAMRYEVGNFLLFFTGLNVAVNLALIIKLVITGTIREKKIRSRKKAYFTRLREIKLKKIIQKNFEAGSKRAQISDYESHQNVSETLTFKESQLDFSTSELNKSSGIKKLAKKTKKSRNQQKIQVTTTQSVPSENQLFWSPVQNQQAWQQQNWFLHYQNMNLQQQLGNYQQSLLVLQQNQIATKLQNDLHRAREQEQMIRPKHKPKQLSIIPEIEMPDNHGQTDLDDLLRQAATNTKLIEQHLQVNVGPKLASGENLEVPLKVKKNQRRRLRNIEDET